MQTTKKTTTFAKNLLASFALLLTGALMLVSSQPVAAQAAGGLAAGSKDVSITTQQDLAATEGTVVNTGKGDLEPGSYYFRSTFANTKVIGLAKAKKTNGINIMVNNVSGAKSQRWNVSLDAKGYAIIKNAATGRLLTVADDKAKSGTQAIQWSVKSKKNLSQRWIFKKQGGGYVICSALNKKLVVGAKGKKASKSLDLTLQKRTNAKRQVFVAAPSAPTMANPGQQTVEDGTYIIGLASKPALAVTIESSSKKTKANAQMWTGGGIAGQAFKITYDGDGFYTVTNVNSNKKLAMGSACSVPGVNVAQYAPVAADLSKWRIDVVDGGYRFVNKATGLALAAEASAAKNGTNVRGWSLSNNDTQAFTLTAPRSFKPTFNGAYYITMTTNQNRVLDPKDAKRYNNVRVQVYKKRANNSNVQKYKLSKAGEGYYYIQNVSTKRMVSLASKSKKSGVGVVMKENEKALTQKWEVVFNDDFSLSFKNAYSGMMLTVANGKTANRTKVKAQTASNALAGAQKFWLQGTTKAKEPVTIGVPCYNQNPQLPTGCESVALTNALRYWGFKLGKTTIANSWMPYGSDGVYNFIGSPHNSSGWIICAPGIERTANRFLDAKNSRVSADNETGTSLKGLRKYLDKGYPVIIWSTIGLGSPGAASYKHGYPLRSNNHCVVLTGYNPETGDYQVADSLVGTVWRSGGLFGTRYRQMGSQAVVLSN